MQRSSDNKQKDRSKQRSLSTPRQKNAPRAARSLHLAQVLHPVVAAVGSPGLGGFVEARVTRSHQADFPCCRCCSTAPTPPLPRHASPAATARAQEQRQPLVVARCEGRATFYDKLAGCHVKTSHRREQEWTPKVLLPSKASKNPSDPSSSLNESPLIMEFNGAVHKARPHAKWLSNKDVIPSFHGNRNTTKSKGGKKTRH